MSGPDGKPCAIWHRGAPFIADAVAIANAKRIH
jgi:hypothetical protein